MTFIPKIDPNAELIVCYNRDWKKYSLPVTTPTPFDHCLPHTTPQRDTSRLVGRPEPEADFEYFPHLND